MNRPGDTIQVAVQTARAAIGEEGAESTSTALPLAAELWRMPLGELLGRAARHRPAAPAIEDGRTRWTWAELAERAGAVASRVRAAGLAPGELVGLRFPPSAPGVAAMLGLAAAGVPFVALDPRHPDDWLVRQAHRLGIAALLALDTDSVSPELATACGRTIRFARDESAPLPEQASVSPDGVLCVISTSGSTGEPKGVIKSHATFLHSAAQYLPPVERRDPDRLLLVSSLGFMAAFPPLIHALVTGGSVHAFAVAERGPEGLLEWIAAQRLSVLDLSPTLLRRLAGCAGDRRLGTVRVIRLAGETIRPSDIRLARGLTQDGVTVVNLLGTAESGLSCLRVVSPGSAIEEPVLHSGAPVAGMRVDLLDDSGRPVADGQSGLMVVRGKTISPGYWRDEGATRESFIEEQNGERTYRSADYARRLPGGFIEHIGRAESLAKVRGERVNPSVPEAALTDMPGVADAAVVVQQGAGADGSDRLVGYIVPRRGHALLPRAVRAVLRTRLPAAMVPAVIMVVERFPMTPSGKVDRGSLPLPPPEPPRPAYRPPRDLLELTVGRVWEKALGVERVGLDDSFEALGGTSMEMPAVLAALEGDYAGFVDPALVAANDRLEDCARALAERVVRPAPLVGLKTTGGKRPFYIVHALHGTVGYYGPLARGIDPDRPIYALQSVGLRGEACPDGSIRAMARRFVREITSHSPGPYLLGGVCMGGVVAWEMTRQLQAAGHGVAQLVLIESLRVRRAPYGSLYRSIQRPLHWRWRRMRHRLSTAARRVAGRTPTPENLAFMRRFVTECNYEAVLQYPVPRLKVRTAAFLVKATENSDKADLREELLREIEGPVERFATPGTHADVCHADHVAVLGPNLRRVLDEAERAWAASR